MANIQLDWEVEGSIQPKESVEGMLKVIREKNENDTGTFWCWDGRVSLLAISILTFQLIICRITHGRGRVRWWLVQHNTRLIQEQKQSCHQLSCQGSS